MNATCGCGRRHLFFGGLAAAFAPAAFAATKPHRIDVHHHLVPPVWLDALKHAGVETRTGLSYRRITSEGVEVELEDGSVETISAERVVIAAGQERREIRWAAGVDFEDHQPERFFFAGQSRNERGMHGDA